MRHSTALGRVVRAVLLILVGLFFLFPILWAITFGLSNLFIKHWLRLRERVHGAR